LKNGLAFQVFPNQIPENEPLQIFLDFDYSGKEKTARRQVFELENLMKGNSFFVRVSDGLECSGTATRLVLKP